MGFFKDLLTPLKPCSLCRLGAEQWTRDRTGVITWSLSGMGLNASLLICPICAQAINRSGLAQKTPIMAVAALAHAGIAERPPVYFYLQHPEWWKVWMHTLETLELNVSDEFQALAAMKEIEAQFFDQAANGL